MTHAGQRTRAPIEGLAARHSRAPRALAAIVALLGATCWFAAADAQPSDELPPVTISSTTFHDGDTITLSGTGCVDPDTGSGDGLVVNLYRPTDFGRGGTYNLTPMLTIDVRTDGTFEGSTVVAQPLAPAGAQTGLIDCRPSGDDDPTSQPLRSRPIGLVIVAPPLPDLTVRAGSTFDYTLPCSIGGGEYGRFAFSVTIPGQDVLYLSVSGTFPSETSPKAGERVSLTVPAGTPAGTYDATAACSVSEGGVSAYYAGFTVTITPAGTGRPSTPGTPGSPRAPGTPKPATPVAGTPSFTG